MSGWGLLLVLLLCGRVDGGDCDSVACFDADAFHYYAVALVKA